MSEHPSQLSGEERDYEDKDIRLLPLVSFMVGALIVTALTFLGVRVLFAKLAGSAASRNAVAASGGAERQLPIGTLLQVTAPQDLAEHRAREAELLHSYAWVNRAAGVARIPVDLAMDILAERGLPTTAPQAATNDAPSTVSKPTETTEAPAITPLH